MSPGISQKLAQFVPEEGMAKISLISLKNVSTEERNISITYYVTPVLGVSSSDTAMHLISSQSEKGGLIVENPYNTEFSNQVLFMDASIKKRSVTGDRKEFFGQGGISSPDSLKRISLSGTVGFGHDPCAAMQVSIAIKAGETVQLAFVLGIAEKVKKHRYAQNYSKQ